MLQHADVGDLAELRLRLYRRDPPSGAVETYLVALQSAPPSPSAPPVRRVRAPRPRARTGRGSVDRRALAAGLRASAATVVALAALGGAAVGLGAASRTAPAARTVSQPAAAAGALRAPAAAGIPIGDLVGDGPASKRFAAEGHPVIVSVLCIGTGTVTVRIGPEPPTVLTCGNGGPALGLLQSTGPLEEFTVSVAPDEPTRWSLAIGAIAAPRPGVRTAAPPPS